ARQQSLIFEAPQQRIERTLVDIHADVGERLAECVAVLLVAQLRQRGDDQHAAPKLDAEVFEQLVARGIRPRHRQYILYITQYNDASSAGGATHFSVTIDGRLVNWVIWSVDGIQGRRRQRTARRLRRSSTRPIAARAAKQDGRPRRICWAVSESMRRDSLRRSRRQGT